jgi:type II secretory pathway component PulL
MFVVQCQHERKTCHPKTLIGNSWRGINPSSRWAIPRNKNARNCNRSLSITCRREHLAIIRDICYQAELHFHTQAQFHIPDKPTL